MKRFIFFLILIFLIFLQGRYMNPLDSRMFNFHDETQPARVREFVLNLKNLQLPPRLAPHFSFNLGYPVFNFYSPTAYWITAIFSLPGMSPFLALKASFFLAVILAFVFMFLFLRKQFGFFPGLIGGVLYASSPWMAVEIFVRGNLAETWFIALFPLSLHLLLKNTRTSSRLIFVLTVFVLSLLLTVHNVFSLLSVIIIPAFAILQKDRKRNFLAFFLAVLLSAYFLIPAVLETKLTYASQIAAGTRYQDHFLCLKQIWNSPWGYGGSVPGCDNDGMSFKLGKIQVGFFILGILTLIFNLVTGRKSGNRKIPLFFLGSSLLALFLTLYQSQFIWDLLAPLLSLFQFPWRFLVFGLFGTGFFSAYFFHHLKIPLKSLIVVFTALIAMFSSRNYFSKPLYTPKENIAQNGSDKYITDQVAYKIPEYLPRTADYNYWRTFNPEEKTGLKLLFDDRLPIESDTNSFQIKTNGLWNKEIIINQPSIVFVNLHYFPFWEIKINGQIKTPDIFDKLGRPVLKIEKVPADLTVNYKQDGLETFANSVSLATLGLIMLFLYKPLWKKFKI